MPGASSTPCARRDPAAVRPLAVEAVAAALPAGAAATLAGHHGGPAKAAAAEQIGERGDGDAGRCCDPLSGPLPRRRRPDRRPAAARRRGGGPPSLHDALVELALDPPVSASDLAGPPRQDDDFLIISTVHSAKGLEWPVVHLPHLVDGAVPSDMALGSPAGWPRSSGCSTSRSPGPATTCTCTRRCGCTTTAAAATTGTGYGQLTRFLDDEALAACESVTAAPLAPLLPAGGSLATKIDAALGALWNG